MKNLTIGICGLGRIGKQHAQTLVWHTRHCEVLAVCSPVREEILWAKKELQIHTAYETLEAMLADPALDAILLATPTSLHAQQILQVLSAGKHVFCEKPLALGLQDCLLVEEQAKRFSHKIIMIGFMRRFDPSYRNAKTFVDAGKLGKTYLVRSQCCDVFDPQGFFVRFAPTSGGIFMDCSVHDIDIARWFFTDAQTQKAPRATKVFASGTIVAHPELQEWQDVDNGLAIVEFEGGLRATLLASRTWRFGHETATEIVGTNGKLQINFGATSAKDRLEIGDEFGWRRLAVGDFYERFHEAYVLEMQAFVDACLNNSAPINMLSDATEATRIGQAITRSYKSGQAELVDY